MCRPQTGYRAHKKREEQKMVVAMQKLCTVIRSCWQSRVCYATIQQGIKQFATECPHSEVETITSSDMISDEQSLILTCGHKVYWPGIIRQLKAPVPWSLEQSSQNSRMISAIHIRMQSEYLSFRTNNTVAHESSIRLTDPLHL